MKTPLGSTIKKLNQVLRKYWLVFLAGFAFAVLCFVVLNAVMEPLSKSEYCGTECHQMSTAYASWKLSKHGANKYGVAVECIDCHLPPKDSYFTHIAAKTLKGAEDVYKAHFGGEYDSEKMRQKVLDQVPNSRCLKCHSDLLGKPGSSGARTAHQATLNPTEDVKPRCVECHDQLHEREKTTFSPE